MARATSKTSWTKLTNTSRRFAGATRSNSPNHHSFPRWSRGDRSVRDEVLIFETYGCGCHSIYHIRTTYPVYERWFACDVAACSIIPSEVKKKTGENLFTAKAYNGRVIVLWLSHCLLDAVGQHPGNDLLVLTSVATIFGLGSLI